MRGLLRTLIKMIQLLNGFENGGPTRRAFLAAAAVVPQMFLAQSDAAEVGSAPFWNQPRWVWLRRHGSKEEIRTVYWADGALIDEEYRKICWFLRDRKLNKAMFMNPILLDVIYAQCGWLNFYGIQRPYISTSGARFASTNNSTEGAAKDGEHTKGNAHDGYFEGVPISAQDEFARWIAAGGVGYYPSRHFIHTDVGRVRYWKG